MAVPSAVQQAVRRKEDQDPPTPARTRRIVLRFQDPPTVAARQRILGGRKLLGPASRTEKRTRDLRPTQRSPSLTSRRRRRLSPFWTAFQKSFRKRPTTARFASPRSANVNRSTPALHVSASFTSGASPNGLQSRAMTRKRGCRPPRAAQRSLGKCTVPGGVRAVRFLTKARTPFRQNIAASAVMSKIRTTTRLPDTPGWPFPTPVANSAGEIVPPDARIPARLQSAILARVLRARSYSIRAVIAANRRST